MASQTDADPLQAEISAQDDRDLRLAAEFDNYRKRTAQDADRRAAAQKEALIRNLRLVNAHEHNHGTKPTRDISEGTVQFIKQASNLWNL